jgi:hypothetical protein
MKRDEEVHAGKQKKGFHTSPTHTLLTAIFISSLSITTAKAQSLDSYAAEIKIYGGLSKLCSQLPGIDICKYAVGEWKQNELEKVKALSPYCIESCGYDVFGFVRTSSNDREYPVVKTKDFDPSAPNRGTEASLYPVVIEIVKYEGCSGCPLIKSFPLKAEIKSPGAKIELQSLGGGMFYIPSEFRRRALNGSIKDGAVISYTLSRNSEEMRLSAVAIEEYAKMLRSLSYDKIK